MNRSVSELSSGGVSRLSGRTWVPALFAVLAIAFATAIVFQFGRNNPDPRSIAASPRKTPPPKPQSTETPSEPPMGVPTAASTPSETDESGETIPLDEGLEQVRADLADFRLRLDYELISTPEGAKQFWAARMELLEYLENLDPAYAGPVVEFLHSADNHLQRRVLLLGLGAMGGDIAAEGLAEHYDTWSEKRRDGPDAVQSEVKYTVEALGRIDNDFSYRLLNHYVDSAPELDRSRFVEALGLHSRRMESVPLFTQLAKSDPRNRVRNKAAQALKRAADPGSAAEIEQMLDVENQPHVRQTLIGALGAIGDPASLKRLDRILREDENSTTRMSAIRSSRLIGGSDAARMLERVAEQDVEPSVRSFARKELVKMDDGG